MSQYVFNCCGRVVNLDPSYTSAQVQLPHLCQNDAVTTGIANLVGLAPASDVQTAAVVASGAVEGADGGNENGQDGE